jgi:hypothetical protein
MESKKDLATMKWKHHSVLAIQDFPLILGRFNPYLNEEKRRMLDTHLTQIVRSHVTIRSDEFRA